MTEQQYSCAHCRHPIERVLSLGGSHWAHSGTELRRCWVQDISGTTVAHVAEPAIDGRHYIAPGSVVIEKNRPDLITMIRHPRGGLNTFGVVVARPDFPLPMFDGLAVWVRWYDHLGAGMISIAHTGNLFTLGVLGITCDLRTFTN